MAIWRGVNSIFSLLTLVRKTRSVRKGGSGGGPLAAGAAATATVAVIAASGAHSPARQSDAIVLPQVRMVNFPKYLCVQPSVVLSVCGQDDVDVLSILFC